MRSLHAARIAPRPVQNLLGLSPGRLLLQRRSARSLERSQAGVRWSEETHEHEARERAARDTARELKLLHGELAHGARFGLSRLGRVMPVPSARCWWVVEGGGLQYTIVVFDVCLFFTKQGAATSPAGRSIRKK